MSPSDANSFSGLYNLVKIRTARTSTHHGKEMTGYGRARHPKIRAEREKQN
jgi:hypothetical protein